MRIVVQRVKKASVTVDGEVCGTIQKGVLVFLGVTHQDTPEQTSWLVNKLVNLRLFPDAQGKMNLGLKEVEGQILVVSQFTLYADCSEGRRPDFANAANGASAEIIYNKFVNEVKVTMGAVQTGKFGASMEVSLVNDGPVTFIIEGK
jgi:D-tyrosyl-tRNA(Tyr) deacylase